jgi:hypothetical protein
MVIQGLLIITWFEVEVLKSLLGIQLEILNFALTMRDDTEPNYTVTNSFFKSRT